jgi:Zn-dependent protease/CBS domain-containing protein
LHFSWIVIAILIVFSLVQQFSFSNPQWGAATTWGAAIITGLRFFVGLFAHELSHAFVARLRGLPIHRITLFLLGGMAQIEKEAGDPGTEFWMGIAGPIMSVVFGLLCLAIARGLGWTPRSNPSTPVMAVLVWLGYINLLLAAFNMIPAFPLDGGRVLRAIIWWFNDDARRSTQIAARIGQFIAVVFIVWGIFRFFTGAGLGGLWLAFIGWFLLQAAGAGYLRVQMESSLRGVTAGDLMSRDCETVDAGVNLGDFVHTSMLRSGRRCYVVVNDHQMIGMITPHQVKQLPMERWGELRVADAMVPASRIHAVAPDTPVEKALELMGKEDINQVPVVANGQLQGVLTRAHVLQLLQARQELNGDHKVAA